MFFAEVRHFEEIFRQGEPVNVELDEPLISIMPSGAYTTPDHVLLLPDMAIENLEHLSSLLE